MLLCLVNLLLGSPAMAHDATPAKPAASPETSAAASLHPNEQGPHCHHGHGLAANDRLLPRAERLDGDAEPPLPEVRALCVPPARLITSGQPSAAPVSSPVPLYLLTERFRS
ncbi:hypothetical protein [Halomonas sp. NO4]|uniref:hypothetical protein n=1 Tax=Halomonas sp. NO4 TaxID=2484813 RepID=UPI0013D05471|nr:hypothetical protein [Halomonas sp. NO4]